MDFLTKDKTNPLKFQNSNSIVQEISLERFCKCFLDSSSADNFNRIVFFRKC